MEGKIETDNSSVETEAPKNKSKTWLLLVILFFVIFYFLFGFITIQPIGSIPDGVTLLIFRVGTQMKFFDSPDALCIREMDGVSLFCRGAALVAISENSTIILRLPYIRAFYLASTGGTEFSK